MKTTMNIDKISVLVLSSVGSLMIMSFPSSASSFDSPNGATPLEMEEVAIDYAGNENSEEISSEIEQVKLANEMDILAISGVTGVGIGQDTIGDEVITVYAQREDVKQRIPSEIQGFKVVVEVTGPIDAL